MSCAHPAAHPCARSCARPVNAQYGPSFPAALALLWPVRPSLVGARNSAVGPDPLWSYAGQQYDADGVSVGAVPAWHAGKGVWCGPGYSNILSAGAAVWPSGERGGTRAGGLFTEAVSGTAAIRGVVTDALYRPSVKLPDAYTIKVRVGRGTRRYIVVSFGFSTAGFGVTFDTQSGVVTEQIAAGGATFLSAQVSVAENGDYIIDVTGKPHTTTLTTYLISVLSAVNAIGNAPQPSIAGTGATIYIRDIAQVTATSFPMPYTPPGTTVASAAGTSGGNGLAWAKTTKLGAIYDGQGTVACKVTLGAASSAVSADTNILTVDDTAVGLIYAASGNKLKSNDGTNTAEVSCTWAANDELLIAVEFLASTFRIGFAKTADSAITWGTAATYDGIHNSGTHLRLARLNAIPMWADGVYVSSATGLTAADIRRYI